MRQPSWILSALFLLVTGGGVILPSVTGEATSPPDCFVGHGYTLSLVGVTREGGPLENLEGYEGFTVELFTTNPETFALLVRHPETGAILQSYYHLPYAGEQQ